MTKASVIGAILIQINAIIAAGCFTNSINHLLVRNRTEGFSLETSDMSMKPENPNSTLFKNTCGASTLRTALLVLFCAGIVFGCAQTRKASYPSDFVYLDRKQIRSEMSLMSLYMQQIDEILLDDSTVSSEQQKRILAILNKIDNSADKLGAGGVKTNHLVIDAHIDQFKLDVSTAISNARADPPNYFALGRLSGSCVGCHKYRN